MFVITLRRRRALVIGSIKLVLRMRAGAQYPVVASLGADRLTWGAFKGSLPDWCVGVFWSLLLRSAMGLSSLLLACNPCRHLDCCI